jgi:ketosteroid isomerase-like protein
MEIKNALQKNFNANELKLAPGSIEIDVRGDFAYAFSTDFIVNKRPREGDEESIEYASAIWLLKKQDGEWKIFRQVYTTRDY